MKIYVVRHGETECNKLGIFTGPDEPLNDLGRAQAADMGKALEDKAFNAIYSSPFLRAHETAEIIMKHNKLGGKIILDEKIREIDTGDYARLGITLAEAHARFKELQKQNPDVKSWPNAEFGEKAFARVGAFLDDLKRNHKKDEKILIVCHGGIMRTIYTIFNPNPADEDPYAYTGPTVANATIAEYILESK